MAKKKMTPERVAELRLKFEAACRLSDRARTTAQRENASGKYQTARDALREAEARLARGE